MAEQTPDRPTVILPYLQCWRPQRHDAHTQGQPPHVTRCAGVLPANPGRLGNWRCPRCNTAPLAKLDEANTRLQCTVCGQLCVRPEDGTPDAPRPEIRSIP